MIIAIDPATKCGFARGNLREKPVCWTNNLGSGHHEGQRFAQLRITLVKLHREFSPQMIAIEKHIQGGTGGNAANVALGIRSIVYETAFLFNTPVKEVAVPTIRKHFLGHGRIPGKTAKKLTMDRCNQLGYDVPDDNAADAAALWNYCAALGGMATAAPNTLFDGKW